MRRLLPLVALGVAALAGATTAPTLTLEQQSKRAQVIVRVTLGTVQTVKDGNLTYLAYPLEVTEVIAGDPATLPQVGGKPGLFVLQGVQDLPKFAARQEALALLYAGRLDSPLVGFNQGWYPVVAGKVTVEGLAETLTDPAKLRDALRAARGTP